MCLWRARNANRASEDAYPHVGAHTQPTCDSADKLNSRQSSVVSVPCGAV